MIAEMNAVVPKGSKLWIAFQRDPWSFLSGVGNFK
jgi:hypothetical protein